MVKTGLVFGAGSIGKSVAGYVLNRLGFKTIFTDISLPVLEDINKRKKYRIFSSQDETGALDIKNIEAVHLDDRKALVSLISEVDFIFTAVGVKGLDTVLHLVSEGIRTRVSHGNQRSVFLLMCENLPDIYSYAMKKLRNELGSHEICSIHPIGTSIERMTKPGDSEGKQFDVIAEKFFPIFFSSEKHSGNELLFDNPELFTPVDNLEAYYYRKLYTNNLGHAVLGYIGYQRGYDRIIQSLKDTEIKRVLIKALREAGEMLVKKYDFKKEDMDAHIEKLVTDRYANKGLNDPVGRVARDPIRKLSRRERLVGAACLCMEYGIYPEAIIETIGYALKYKNPDDSQSLELSRLLSENGIEAVLDSICGLNNNEPIYDKLVDMSHKITGGIL